MKKNYNEELHERVKLRVEKNLGTPKFRWFILILNLLIFSAIYFYSLMTWGKDVAIQYFIQTFVAFIVFELILYFGLTFFWKYFSIPEEIFDQQNKEIEDLKSLINSPVTISARSGQDEERGTHIFKQIKLISQSPQTLLCCFATIETFCELLSNGTKKNIEPVSRQVSWAITGRRTPDNKVNLIRGIPENLYLARIDSNEKRSYLMGEGGNNTPLSKKGKYLIQIRLTGENFQPHIFTVKIDFNGKDSVKIINVSNPSLISFFTTNVGFENKLNTTLTQKK